MTGDGKFDILLVAAGGASAALDRTSGAVANAADASSALAALKPRRGATVLAVADSVFQQSVRLPAPQADALSPQELESALFYEVEPFCGLRRDEAALASVRLPGGEWAVSVAPIRELERLDNVAAAARCRLEGVAALPAGTSSSPASVLNSILAADAPNAPVITPPRRSSLSPRRIAIASAALLALAALGCLSDWLRLSIAERRLAPRLAASEAAAGANARILSEIRADEGRVAELEAMRQRRETAAAALAIERDAWLHLLRTIAIESSGGDFALVAITAADGGGASIQCVAPSADAAAGALARLSSAMSPHGWALRPDAMREGGAGLAAFSFQAERSGKEARRP